jgi:hypothetical protein
MVALATRQPDRTAHFRAALREEARLALSKARRPLLRSRVQFAEEVIVCPPSSQFRGQRWRKSFQPYAWYLLNEMDAMNALGIRKHAATGCVQSGKTTNVIDINVCWHLFERRETVGYLVPEIETMGRDRWENSLLPLIMASPWMRSMMPERGGGSRGGFNGFFKFTNGAILKFFTAQGSDDKRASFPLDVIFKTEVDRYDRAKEASREASAAVTIEDRIAAQADRGFIYEECTMTVEDGRINKQVRKGTDSKLQVCCDACKHWVHPTRDHLVGVEEAENVVEAKSLGRFICPKCAVIWDADGGDEERFAMLSNMRVLHRGQTIVGTDGAALIEGAFPPTDVHSFSWNAFFNKFWPTSYLSGLEWETLHADDPGEADRQARQKRWTIPAEADEFVLTPLTVADLKSRRSDLDLGLVPEGTFFLSAGSDLRQTQLHFVVRAWFRTDKGAVQSSIVDVGTFKVDSVNFGVRNAVLDALISFRDRKLLKGYFDAAGNRYAPGFTLVDMGWQERIVWEFMLDCAALGIKGLMPIIGRGQSQPPGYGSYVHPDAVSPPDSPNRKILWIGENCHMRKSSRYEQLFINAGMSSPPAYVIANSDEWKSFNRDGLATPRGVEGALMTFKPKTEEEQKLLEQYHREVLAEVKYRKVVEGRGPVDLFKNSSRKKNHLGDCDYYSCVAAHLGGVRVTIKRGETPPPPTPPTTTPPTTMPDGRPYMAA